MLALAIVGVAALLTPTGWIFPSGRQRIAALLIVVVCAPVALTLTSGQFGSRVEDLQGQDSTGSGRVNLWRAAWTSIEERPILGLGYGAFSTVSNDLMLETPETDLSDFVIREQGPEAHNSYVGTAAELGVVGLVLFLAMIASIITLFWRIARQELQRGPPPETAQRRRPSLRGSAAAAFVVGLAGWLAGGIFLSLEVVRPFWIILGLALALGALGTDRRAGDDHGAVRTGT
jgi:O-antigen ligase